MSRPGIFIKSLLQRPERFFTALGIIFGLLFIFLVPPLQTPDEIAHFLRVYQVSQFYLISNNKDGVPGDYLPQSINRTIEVLTTPQIKFNTNLKYDLSHTKAVLKMNLEKDKTKFTSVSGTSAYSPIGYIPQAVLVGFASIFNTPPILLMYIARVGSLVAWLGLLGATIKIMPYRKWTVAGLGLLPMLIGLAASPGIDAVSIGLGVLFIAIVLRLIHEPKVPRKWWIALLVLGCLTALTKQTTLLAVGFVLLLPASRFGANRRNGLLKKASLIIAPLLCIAVWTIITIYFHLSSSSGVPGQSLHGQLSNIIHNPFRFPDVIFNTFFLTWGDNVITSFAGTFGWADTPLSEGIIVAVFVYISYLLLRSYERVRMERKRYTFFVTTVLIALYCIGTMAALYLFYSPTNYDVIYGLQGRYFLFTLFIALPLSQLLQKTTDLKIYSTVVRVMAPVLLVCAGLTIYLRYYIKLF